MKNVTKSLITKGEIVESKKVLCKKQQNKLTRIAPIGCLMLAMALSACSSTGDKRDADKTTTDTVQTEQNKSVNSTKESTKENGNVKSKAETDASLDNRVGSAITSPLGDLNLVRADIPAVLINARKAPYTVPDDAGCVWFTTEIQSLDQILGPDLDAVKVDAKGNIVEKELGNATVNALKSFTEGFVPFRSLVRRITGADSHSREVAAAGMAGIVRRSYLKGVASAKACRIDPVPGMSAPQAVGVTPVEK